MLLLSSLERRARDFLLRSSSVDTVLPLLLDPRLEPYDVLRDYYISFLATPNVFKIVRKQEDFKKLIDSVDEVPENSAYRKDMIHKIFMKLSFSKSA
jgi:hypothetical protein